MNGTVVEIGLRVRLGIVYRKQEKSHGFRRRFTAGSVSIFSSVVRPEYGGKESVKTGRFHTSSGMVPVGFFEVPAISLPLPSRRPSPGTMDLGSHRTFNEHFSRA